MQVGTLTSLLACELPNLLASGSDPPDLAIEAPQLLSQVGPFAFKLCEPFLREIPEPQRARFEVQGYR
jgi:hypothetical protein